MTIYLLRIDLWHKTICISRSKIIIIYRASYYHTPFTMNENTTKQWLKHLQSYKDPKELHSNFFRNSSLAMVKSTESWWKSSQVQLVILYLSKKDFYFAKISEVSWWKRNQLCGLIRIWGQIRTQFWTSVEEIFFSREKGVACKKSFHNWITFFVCV